jgi:hypothetical protein
MYTGTSKYRGKMYGLRKSSWSGALGMLELITAMKTAVGRLKRLLARLCLARLQGVPILAVSDADCSFQGRKAGDSQVKAIG